MPGTIHVSVLELVGLPSPPQSSSMGVKVSMGKQAHEMQDKEETTFALASLRDNLNVSIHDSEGNEIAHTDVETRSIVEKGTWDDTFPLKDGGHIRMRLHFILTEEELNRIRRMRESAARKKQEDLLKRSRSSSDLAGASGGSPASSQDSPKSRRHTQERSVEPSDGQANKISADSNVKVLNKAQPGQKKQVFSTSKSTGALDKLPAYQQLKERIQGQNAEQQSQLDKTPSNVRKTRLAFESSPVKEESPASNKTWATTQLSSSAVDIPSKEPSLKKMVVVNTKPVLSKLETATDSSTPEEIEEERGKLLSATNKTEEMVQLSSNTRVDIPSKVPILKKTVVFDTKPVLSNLESVPAPSTPEEIGELFPATKKTKETAQLRSNTRVDNPSKVPILKKTAAVNTKPVLFDLETAPAPSTPEEIGKERGKLLLDNKTEETAQLSSNTRVDTPKVPILKKIVAVNSETAPALSTPEELGKEKGRLLPSNNKTKETDQLSNSTRVENPFKLPLLKKIVSVNSVTVLSNPETAPAPSTSEGIGKERGEDGDNGSTHQNISHENNISKTQPSKEENKEEKKTLKKLHTSPVSLKSLLEALPRRKQSSTGLFNRKYGFTTKDALVVKKKWRSKQWESSQCRAKSKVLDGNEHCSSNSFRGWIFLDEMIRSCVLSDDRPFVDELEVCHSHCSQDNDQEKLTDTHNAQRKSEKDSIGSKKLESNGKPNNMPFNGPGGQVVKIAVMAGFGLLVLLTRQRK